MLQIPPAGDAVNDYNTPNLQAHAFPTLFPYGVGDFTNHDRQVDKTDMKDIAKHFMFYCVVENGKFRYPFVEHERWVYWMQNTLERHRHLQQRRICLARMSPNVTGMDMDQLNEFIERRDPEAMRTVTSQMNMYNANIPGTDSYLANHKRNLEGLVAEKGSPTFWMTYTAGDNYWIELHSMAVQEGHYNEDEIGMTETDKAVLRRKWVRDNPHIVDHYFFMRAKEYFNSFYGKDCLNAEWYWYRIEYQKRGSAHVHGCCRLKSDPNLPDLAQKVVHGREAQLAWIASGDPHPLPDPHFSPEDMEEDKIVRPFPEGQELSEEMIDALTLKIVEGVDAQRRLLRYHDFLLTVMHPTPPSDATADARDEASRFHQTDTNRHPCAADPNNTNAEHYCQLIDACQRHRCCNYCERKDKAGNTFCRLGFPHKLRGSTVLAIKQTVLKNSQRIHTSFEIVPARNDKWLNIQCRFMFQTWMANMDMRLTPDLGKVLAYMTKYITKTETSSVNSRRNLYSLLRVVASHSTSTPEVLRKMYNELSGERAKTKPEVCHHLLSLSLVCSDHQFVKINLANDNSLIDRDEDAANNDGSTTLVSLMTVIDGYAKRLNDETWKCPTMHQHEMEQEALANMSLNAFAQKYRMGQRGDANRNKIIPHGNQGKWVANFYPNRPSGPDSPDYANYCKFQLLRYRPWVDDYYQGAGSVVDGVEATPEQIIQQWEAFALSFSDGENNQGGATTPPHLLRQVIAEIRERLIVDNEFRDAVGVVDSEEGRGGASVGTGDSVDNLPAPGEMEYSYLGCDSYFGTDMDSDDTMQVPWNPEHNWAATETDLTTTNRYEDPQKEFDVWRKGSASDWPADFVRTHEGPVIHRGALNEKQRKFMEVMDRLLDPNYVSSTDSSGSGSAGLLSRCVMLRGRGGTGKSHCMRCLQSELPEDQVKALATTGKAATVLFRGSTVHNTVHGLAIPVGKDKKYTPLKPDRLRQLQEQWKNVKVVFVDEMTMLKPHDLHHIHLRLQEVKACHQRIFGGIIVVLVGDTAQLPPVQGSALWTKVQPRMSDTERNGLVLYQTNFTTVIELDENNRLQRSDPDAASFHGFLNRLADGKCTKEDWLLVKHKSSHTTLGDDEWRRRGFNDRGVIHLYSTNEMVEKHNLRELTKQNKPILRIEATNNCARAAGMTCDKFGGLQRFAYLCIGSTVVLTTNLCPEMGLSNGSTGIVKDIEFRGVNPPVEEGSWNPKTLPYCVWVDFDDKYHGPPFFNNVEQRGWVPISPISLNEYVRRANSDQETVLTRTMIPLKLAWAWTIWKVQGQTVDGKVVVDLGPTEKEHGLSYVAFSRVRRFQDLGVLGGCSLERLTTKISGQKKLKNRLDEDARLARLQTQTLAYLDQEHV